MLSDHIYKMYTDISPDASVAKYENLLHKFFDDKSSSFDLVLLGMGDDGHTISLFPGNEISGNSTAWVIHVCSENKGERISLTPSLVNKASSVAFLITGENKSKILQQIIEEPEMHNYPVQLIRPENNELHFFLDSKAAKNLTIPKK